MKVLEIVSKTNYLNGLIHIISYKYSITKNVGYNNIENSFKEIMQELENCELTDTRKINDILSKMSELRLKLKLIDREERLSKIQ